MSRLSSVVVVVSSLMGSDNRGRSGMGSLSRSSVSSLRGLGWGCSSGDDSIGLDVGARAAKYDLSLNCYEFYG